jgi:hypothetical protein
VGESVWGLCVNNFDDLVYPALLANDLSPDWRRPIA